MALGSDAARVSSRGGAGRFDAVGERWIENGASGGVRISRALGVAVGTSTSSGSSVDSKSGTLWKSMVSVTSRARPSDSVPVEVGISATHPVVTVPPWVSSGPWIGRVAGSLTLQESADRPEI